MSEESTETKKPNTTAVPLASLLGPMGAMAIGVHAVGGIIGAVPTGVFVFEGEETEGPDVTPHIETGDNL